MRMKTWFMNKKVLGCHILLAILLFPVCDSVYAFLGGKINTFTADQVFMDPKGQIISQGKLYVTPQKIRIDGLPGPEKSQSLGVIYHRDEKRQCTFNPQKKLYFEGPMDEERLKQDLKPFGSMSEKAKILGTEKVSGYECTKREVETTVKVMGFTQKSRHIVWVSDRFEMPLRTQTQDGAINELRNIVKGAPGDEYFETPRGYQRVSSLMAVMGMDFSGAGDADSAPDQNAGERPFKLPDALKKFKLPFGEKN